MWLIFRNKNEHRMKCPLQTYLRPVGCSPEILCKEISTFLQIKILINARSEYLIGWMRDLDIGATNIYHGKNGKQNHVSSQKEHMQCAEEDQASAWGVVLAN